MNNNIADDKWLGSYLDNVLPWNIKLKEKPSTKKKKKPMKNKNHLPTTSLALILMMTAASSPAYEILSVKKDTWIKGNSAFIQGASPYMKIDSAKSQAYLEFPLPSSLFNESTKANLILQTRCVRRAKNLHASEVTESWNERTLIAPKGIGSAKSKAIMFPQRGLLKLDVTDLVKAQMAAGRTNINLALATERGGLHVMTREAGLGAQLEICNSDTPPLSSGSSSPVNQFIEVSISVKPPTIESGALWSTNIVGLTQPGDTILSAKGFGLTDNLLPSCAINAQGELQIGIKNLHPQNNLNPPQQNLTFCILR